jgi:hypothetical protein
MVDDHPQNADSQDSIPPRPLSPRNPLDHLRLLWWVLVTPQQLKAYREAFGEDAECKIGGWLSSTLTWMPPLIPILALGLGIVPSSDDQGLFAIFYLGLSLALVVAWALTANLIEETGCLAAIVAFGIMLLIALVGVVLLRVRNDAGNAVEAALALGLVIGIMTGVAPVIPGGVPDIVAFLAPTGTVSAIAGGLAFLVAFMTRLITVPIVRVVEVSLGTGNPSWLARGVFVVLVLGYAFLIWFSFLGGWQVFQ